MFNIDKTKIQYWFRNIDDIFADFKGNALDYADKTKRRIFIDNQSDVLFVAHLDTVLPPKIHKQTKKRIYAQGLDDRLGCLIAYQLSVELKADLLLTDNEESGQTTAQYHDCKEYNWVCEFDRAGSDVVTYGIDNADFLQAIKKSWKVGLGSYSDICELKTDAACVNIGIGYEYAHSKNSYADKKTIKKQIAKFKRFYQDNHKIKYVRDVPYRQRIIYDDYWTGYDQDDIFDRWSNADICDVCGCQTGHRVYEYYICRDCLTYFVESQQANVDW